MKRHIDFSKILSSNPESATDPTLQDEFTDQNLVQIEMDENQELMNQDDENLTNLSEKKKVTVSGNEELVEDGDESQSQNNFRNLILQN